MTECEREVLRWRGVSELWLEVSLHNTAAMEFYRALGYELVDETSGNEGGPAPQPAVLPASRRARCYSLVRRHPAVCDRSSRASQS